MQFEAIYCLNCEGLKGFKIFGHTAIYHPPCKLQEHKAHMVQYFIAPKGYVSAFMKDGIGRAVIMQPKQGPILRIAKAAYRNNIKARMRIYEGEIIGPYPVRIEEFRVLRHFNVFGANLYYVLEDGRLYYKEDSGEDRFDQEGARKHLAECMKLAREL